MEQLKRVFGVIFDIFSTILFFWLVSLPDELVVFSDTVQIVAYSVGGAALLAAALFMWLKNKVPDWVTYLCGTMSLACLSRLSAVLFGVSPWLSVAIGFAALTVIILVVVLIYAFH